MKSNFDRVTCLRKRFPPHFYELTPNFLLFASSLIFRWGEYLQQK